MTPHMMRIPKLLNRSIAFVIFAANQDFALAGVIWLANDAFLFHPFDERGGAIIAELEPALDVARRRLAVPDHDLDGLLVEVGALGIAHAGRIEYSAIPTFQVVLGRDRVQV